MGYVVYVHSDARMPVNKTYAYYATGIFADVKGKNLLHTKVVKMEHQSNNLYTRAIQCYANALEMLYQHQQEFLDDGVTNALLVLNSKVICKWIKDKPPVKHQEIFDRIHQLYGFGGSKEIRLTVGLASGTVKNKMYEFCAKRYITK